MEKPQQCGEIRKERELGQKLGGTQRKLPDPCGAMRAKPWGNPFRDGSHSRFRGNRDLKGRYVMDLFA